MTVYRPDGRVLMFTQYNSVYTPDADVADRLVQTSNGWEYQTADDTIETYDSFGDLLSIAKRGQAPITISRSNPGDPPSSVSDAFGHTLQFSYVLESLSGGSGVLRLGAITDPSGKKIQYVYTNNNPTSATYQDGTSHQYSYQDGYNGYGLTTLTDEANVGYASWTYTSRDLQVATAQLAGGVDAYSFTYTTNSGAITSTTVKDPLNQSRTYAQSLVWGVNRMTGSSVRTVSWLRGRSVSCAGCERRISLLALISVAT